jgi:hypothetical protein
MDMLTGIMVVCILLTVTQLVGLGMAIYVMNSKKLLELDKDS